MSIESDKVTIAKLCYAILNNDMAEIKLFLKQNPDLDLNIKTNAGYSPIYYAVTSGNYDLVRKLKNRHAKLDEIYDGLNLSDIAKQNVLLATKNNDHGSTNDYALTLYQLERNDIYYDKKKINNFINRIDISDGYQSWIKNPLKLMGYEHRAEGYCNGVAHMGAQALVLDERDENGDLIQFKKFDDRTQQLVQMKNVHFLSEIEFLKHKKLLLLQIAKNELSNLNKPLNSNEKQRWLDEYIINHLSPAEKINMQIIEFLDGVELFQQINEHNDLLAKPTNFQNTIAVIPLTSSIELDKKGGMVIADYFTGVYNENELSDLFKTIQHLSTKNKYQSPIVLQFTANLHALTISYDSLKNNWVLIDTNKYNKDASIIHKFNDPMLLTKEVMNRFSFKGKIENQLLIRTNILTSAAQTEQLIKKVTKPLRESRAWKAIHKITPEKLSFKNLDNKTLAEEACFNGDKETLKKIHKFNNRSFLRDKKTILSIIGGLALGAALVVAGIFTGGATVAGALLITLGMVSGVLATGIPPILKGLNTHFDKKQPSNEMKKALELHQIKQQHLKSTLAAYNKTIKKASSKFNHQPTTESNKKTTTNFLHIKLNVSTMKTAVNDVPLQTVQTSNVTNSEELLTKSYSVISDQEQIKQFKNTFITLNQFEQITALLKHQDQTSIQDFYGRLNRDMQIAVTTGIDIDNVEGIKKAMAVLDSAYTMMQPYSLITDANERAKFRDIYLNLPEADKVTILQRFQQSEDINKLMESFKNYKLPLTKEISLCEQEKSTHNESNYFQPKF